MISPSLKHKNITESGSTFREIVKSGLDDISGPELSNAAIRDELAFQLGSTMIYHITDNGVISIDHKYSILANYVLYRMCIWTSPPVFVINTSDLSRSLCHELEQFKKCDPKGFDQNCYRSCTVADGRHERTLLSH